MKNSIIIIFLLLAACSFAQPPHRTPDDIARKQTDMMVRELHITDSIVRDTLFRMHLKYVLLREQSNTRADAIEYIQLMNAELKQILTEEQYLQFMSQQVNHAPHRHHSPCNRIVYNEERPIPSSNEAPDMPPSPLERQQVVPQ